MKIEFQILNSDVVSKIIEMQVTYVINNQTSHLMGSGYSDF